MAQIQLKQVLFLLLLFIIVIALRIFYRLSSKIYREHYTHMLRNSVITGLVLGMILPWDTVVGLMAALFTGLVLLFISIFSVLVMSKSSQLGFLQETWIRREVLREWFMYVSIITGMIGIVSTVLSILLPPFLDLTLGVEVPLVFDTISVTAALLDLSIPITSYRKINSLIYLYLLEEKGEEEEGFVIDDTEFMKAVRGTEFTDYEVRDALESLVEIDMASKMTATSETAQVEFHVSYEGMRLLKLQYDETILKLGKRLERINEGIHRIQEDTEGEPTEAERRSLQMYIKQLLDELDQVYRENRCFRQSGQCLLQVEELKEIREKLQYAGERS